MKHFLMNKADEGTGAGGSTNTPDVGKIVSDGFKELGKGLEALSKRIEAQEKRASAPAPKPKAKEEDETDLADEILVNPKKAVEKITAKVKAEVESSVNNQSQAQNQFATKFNDLAGDYPELADQKSELHQRAKAILGEITSQQWDSNALEQAVFRAVSEKGVLPMKHRKQETKDDDADDDGYLGSGSSYSKNEGGTRRRDKDSKLDPRTKAFAELAGLNVNDAKVVERLTKTQNERRGQWNKYR